MRLSLFYYFTDEESYVQRCEITQWHLACNKNKIFGPSGYTLKECISLATEMSFLIVEGSKLNIQVPINWDAAQHNGKSTDSK